MNPDLQHKFSTLEKRKNGFCAELKTWPAQRLFFRETNLSWSALQLLDHLIRTEKSIASVMRSNLGRNNPISFLDRFKSQALCSFLRLPVRVKIPEGAASLVSPGEHPDYPTLASAWQNDRKELAQFLGLVTEQHAREGLFYHPVSGWTNAHGALRFIDAHMAHHTYQLARIRRASFSAY